MAIVKLANAGESVTWKIKSASVTAGKFGTQLKFESDSGDLLFVSEETAVRQLDRIPLSVEDCVGETLVFSRDENKKGGAPYWGIKLASPGDAVKPSGQRVGSPYQAPAKKPLPFDEESFPSEEYGESVADPLPPVPEWVEEKPKADTASAYKRKQIADSYCALLKYVIENSKLTDQNACQAAAATIFIQWKNAGVV